MTEERTTYKIGQAANLLEVEPYVLRFWETEFPELKPIRTSSGQRIYSEEHIELIKKIKHLLYDKKMTIEGAKQYLKGGEQYSMALKEIKGELLEIKKLLEKM